MVDINKLCGWAGEEEAKKAWEAIGDQFPKYATPPTETRRMMLWEVVRKVLGKDTPNYAQEVGDCYASTTLIEMSDGSKKRIEDIERLDKIVNHLNQEDTVIDLIRRNYTGKLITIHVGKNKLTATATHHAFYIDKFDLLQQKLFKNYKVGDDVIVTKDVDNGNELVKVVVKQKITKITSKYVENYPVYCVMTEQQHSLVANNIISTNCVSFGAKNAIEYLACVDIFVRGEAEKFRPIFPPYLYGTGRVFIGNGQLGNSDGSLGSWQAKAVEKYGAIPSDEEGTPKYSGTIARQWGRRPGPPDKFVELGKQHLVQSTVKVETWEDFVKFICNGYPVTIASNVGFEMQAGSDGFHNRSGSWGHQMCGVGVDDEYEKPHCAILNSWGDVHGTIKDFKTGEPWPKGTLRVHKKDIESMLAQGDSFAYSQWLGFPEQRLSVSDINTGGT